MTRDEQGAATVLAVALTALLGLVAVIGVGVGGLVSAHRRVAGAADLAALAGAAARERGLDPCAAAMTIAGRNGATVTECSVGPASILVVAQSEVAGLEGVRVRARARAGP